jgi:ubiquitin carboxyl-terminal hydrolase 7
MEGDARPVMEANAVDVTVYVRVVKDPTGVLWNDFITFVPCFATITPGG